MEKNFLKFKFKELFNHSEIYVISVLVIYSILALLFNSSFTHPLLLLNYNFAMFAIILTAALISKMYSNKYLQILRIVYIAPIVYMIYLNTQNYVRTLNPFDYDSILIAWDKAIFGADPTAFFDLINYPILTEFFQICYFSFFFLPVIHGFELYFRGKGTELKELINQIVFGFLLSYLLYFAMPAIGPRFTLYEFSELNAHIPGVFITDFLRDFINSGGGIPADSLHPAMDVNRDCMPSGHTMMTLLNIILAFRFRSKLRFAFLIIGSGLIISTLYLRYHYGVDVIAGIGCALISLYLEPYIRSKIKVRYEYL